MFFVYVSEILASEEEADAVMAELAEQEDQERHILMQERFRGAEWAAPVSVRADAEDDLPF